MKFGIFLEFLFWTYWMKRSWFVEKAIRQLQEHSMSKRRTTVGMLNSFSVIISCELFVSSDSFRISTRYFSNLQKITSGTGFNFTVGIVCVCQRVVDLGVQMRA